MSFRQLDFQRFDETGNYALNEEYVLSYLYSDGWTERLLYFKIFIDIYYECKGQISFYNRSKTSQKIEADIGFEAPFEIPVEIKNLIDLLVNQKELGLQNHYSDFFLEDSVHVNFVINHKEISHNVSIGILLEEVQNQNESEKLIFLLNKEFKKLREEMYNKMLLDE